MTNCSKKVSMKWTSHLAQRWTKIPGAQQYAFGNDVSKQTSKPITSFEDLASTYKDLLPFIGSIKNKYTFSN